MIKLRGAADYRGEKVLKSSKLTMVQQNPNGPTTKDGGSEN